MLYSVKLKQKNFPLKAYLNPIYTRSTAYLYQLKTNYTKSNAYLYNFNLYIQKKRLIIY